MYSQSIDYQSPYIHQHSVPMSRHVGSYNLGVSPSHPRLGGYDIGGLGNQQMVQSRFMDGSQLMTPQGSIAAAQRGGVGAYSSPYAQNQAFIQSQQITPTYPGYNNNSQVKYIGQGAQQQQNQQSQLQQQQQLSQQQQLGQQQQQQGNVNTDKQQSQQLIGQGNVINSGVGGNQGNQIDINNTANYENYRQPGNNNPDVYKNDRFGNNGAYVRYANDHADRDLHEQELAATKRRNPYKVVGPAYAYDDIDSDQRIRKPPDQEHEQKLQKLKSEKTKRELHVQELDYKIHILEQENQSLRNQMDQMKTDYQRLKQVYEEKYSHEIDRLHLENQDYENSNKQWATRFKDLEAKCDDLVQDKQDLEEENRKLNDKILKIQVLLHEQPIKNQMRFDGGNKNF